MELWKPVPSVPLVEASNYGQVRFAVAHNSYPAHHLLHLGISRRKYADYKSVFITINGKLHGYYVHRLVCEAFHGPPPSPTHHAAHRNGRSFDNRPDNLAWATIQENNADRDRMGRTQHGSRHYRAVLHEGDIPLIRRLLAANFSPYEIAPIFGVSPAAIYQIKTGKSWKES